MAPVSSATQEKYDEIVRLLSGTEWRQWVEFLGHRHKALQNKVNQAVDKGSLEEARIARALMVDCKRQAQEFIDAQGHLRKQIEGAE